MDLENLLLTFFEVCMTIAFEGTTYYQWLPSWKDFGPWFKTETFQDLVAVLVEKIQDAYVYWQNRNKTTSLGHQFLLFSSEVGVFSNGSFQGIAQATWEPFKIEHLWQLLQVTLWPKSCYSPAKPWLNEQNHYVYKEWKRVQSVCKWTNCSQEDRLRIVLSYISGSFGRCHGAERLIIRWDLWEGRNSETSIYTYC